MACCLKTAEWCFSAVFEWLVCWFIWKLNVPSIFRGHFRWINVWSFSSPIWGSAHVPQLYARIDLKVFCIGSIWCSYYHWGYSPCCVLSLVCLTMCLTGISQNSFLVGFKAPNGNNRYVKDGIDVFPLFHVGPEHRGIPWKGAQNVDGHLVQTSCCLLVVPTGHWPHHLCWVCPSVAKQIAWQNNSLSPTMIWQGRSKSSHSQGRFYFTENLAFNVDTIISDRSEFCSEEPSTFCGGHALTLEPGREPSM